MWSSHDGRKKWHKHVGCCHGTAKEHDIPVESLEWEKLAERFPHSQYTEESKHILGLFEPGAGYVKPENAILAPLEDAKDPGAGADTWETTRVFSLKEKTGASPDSSHVEIAVQRGDSSPEMIQAKKSVLLGAGAWSSKLIPSLEAHLKPIRQLQTWVDISSTVNPDMYDGGKQMPAHWAAFLTCLSRSTRCLRTSTRQTRTSTATA